MQKLWLAILFSFLVGLCVWAIVGIEQTQHRIAIFAIVGVILTAITSVLTIVINNKEARDRETMILMRKEQQRVFNHFYTGFFEILKDVKGSNSSNPSERAIEEMYQFRQGLMNWGSEELIAGFINYEADLEASATAGTTAMIEVGDRFMKQMRKELGFEDAGRVNIMSVILDTQARKELRSG